jgi:phage terminase large subunit GpA-like protein
VADRGWNYVLTELQNDPPADETDETDKLSEFVVRGSASGYQGRMTGLPAGQMPPGALVLTAAVDVNDAFLTWEVCAWLEKRRCVVVDYGKQATDSRSTVGLDRAIWKALDDIKEDFEKKGYKPDLALVDSGDGRLTDLIYKWCQQARGAFFPSKGDGRYTTPKGKDGKRQEMLHFHFTTVPGLAPKQLIVMQTDYWKTECHEAFKVAPLDKAGMHAAGAVRLFGVEPLRHKEFAEEVTAEQFVREFVEGKPSLKEGWVRGSKANHWLDTHYMNYAARGVVELWQRVKNAPQRRYGVLSKGV